MTCAACGPDAEPEIDPVATYDAFGQAFEPAAALPVQAVLAEPDRYADTAIMVEGDLYDECDVPDCWLTMKADTTRLVIQQPDFDAPASLAGRRAVVHGRLHQDAADFTLDPTGVMVEKVRS